LILFSKKKNSTNFLNKKIKFLSKIFKLDASRRRDFPLGERDKMVGPTMFFQGITFLGRRGATSHGERD
jgi:hypothetical protein